MTKAIIKEQDGFKFTFENGRQVNLFLQHNIYSASPPDYWKSCTTGDLATAYQVPVGKVLILTEFNLASNYGGADLVSSAKLYSSAAPNVTGTLLETFPLVHKTTPITADQEFGVYYEFAAGQYVTVSFTHNQPATYWQGVGVFGPIKCIEVDV